MSTTVDLRVQGVGFSYGSSRALDDVSCTASTGVTGLIGANGAGKTTLLKLIAGVLRPDSGRIDVSGAGEGAPLVGYLPQSPAPTPLLTAQSYVEYFAVLAGVPRRRVTTAATTALDTVGLAERASSRTSKLSGGMFRRVALAAALVAEPALVLLDEPTAGLDPVQRARFRDLIEQLGEERAVIVASHILEDIEPIAARVVVLNGSRQVFEGTVPELAKAGEAVLRTDARPSLESAFLAMLDDGKPR